MKPLDCKFPPYNSDLSTMVGMSTLDKTSANFGGHTGCFNLRPESAKSWRCWRRCMGIEPTQDGTSALLTVLKTAEPTRTLPPPLFQHFPTIFDGIIYFSHLRWKRL